MSNRKINPQGSPPDQLAYTRFDKSSVQRAPLLTLINATECFARMRKLAGVELIKLESEDRAPDGADQLIASSPEKVAL